MLKSRWYQQKYHLDRMSFRDLIWAYVSYPGIQVYFLLLMGSSTLGIMVYRHDPGSPMLLVLSVVGTFMAYPFVEYGVHRFILHGRYLYRSPWTAALWK
ncbi:MAG: fatty acid hydroxylase family protein, partial [Nitrospirota bacterium]|nr:fatty acid hydroxylase family protein [Nitrospirota bacterium]